MPVVSSTLESLGSARRGTSRRPLIQGHESTTPAAEIIEVTDVVEITDSVELLDAIDALHERDDHEEETETRELHTVVCGYRIGSLLGRGGLSVVFDVTHPGMSEALAMKVVTDPRIQDELAAEAIYAHATAISRLRSPHVVRTFDAGRLPSGEPFVVMERLEGEDLGVRLREKGPLPVADAVRFVIQACEGLAEAHEAGIVHGDIKPGNILLARDPQGGDDVCLKILDFAPSVPREGHPDDPLVTCSPGYASPEQLGARADVDGRADVWALGAVLYELVTGSRAFDATTLPDMLQVIGRVPPSMKALRSDVPAALDIIVRRCLARDREARFESALQLRDALVALHMNEAAEADWRATASVPPSVRRLAADRLAAAKSPPRHPSRVRRRVFLAMLGPACALVSMTIVRMLLASHLVAPPAPIQWPAAAPLAPLADIAAR